MPILEAGLVGRAVFATRMPVFETIDPGLLHLIRAGETPQDAARDILAWMETDRRYRLRRDIRRNLTWDAVYRNSIRKLIGRSPRRKEAKG